MITITINDIYVSTYLEQSLIPYKLTLCHRPKRRTAELSLSSSHILNRNRNRNRNRTKQKPQIPKLRYSSKYRVYPFPHFCLRLYVDRRRMTYDSCLFNVSVHTDTYTRIHTHTLSDKDTLLEKTTATSVTTKRTHSMYYYLSFHLIEGE